MTVRQTESGSEKAKIKVGKLYMIDLAGSERAHKTQVCYVGKLYMIDLAGSERAHKTQASFIY